MVSVFFYYLVSSHNIIYRHRYAEVYQTKETIFVHHNEKKTMYEYIVLLLFVLFMLYYNNNEALFIPYKKKDLLI